MISMVLASICLWLLLCPRVSLHLSLCVCLSTSSVLCLVNKLSELHDEHMNRPSLDDSQKEHEIEILTKEITEVSTHHQSMLTKTNCSMRSLDVLPLPEIHPQYWGKEQGWITGGASYGKKCDGISCFEPAGTVHIFQKGTVKLLET